MNMNVNLGETKNDEDASQKEWECLIHGKIPISKTYPSYVKNRMKWCIECSRQYTAKAKAQRPWMRAWRTLTRSVHRKTGQRLRWQQHGLPILKDWMDKEWVDWSKLRLEWCPDSNETFSTKDVHVVFSKKSRSKKE